VPAVTLAHVPLALPVLASEHAVHVNVHAALQQKPSTQKPLRHSPASVHAAPCASLVHAAAPLHVVTPAHSLSGSVAFGTFPHVPLMPPFFAALHAWHRPLHAALPQKPSAQKPLWHCEGSVHAVPFTASHAAAPLHSVAHSPSGSVLAAMLPHAPFAPEPFFVVLHAWQTAAQAVLQQKPSTQKPLVHSAASVHVEPCPSVEHVPDPLQLVTPAHSLSGSVAPVTLAHVPLAAPVLALLQALQSPPQAVLQQKPSAQKPLAHSLAAAHAAPVGCFTTQAPALQYAMAAQSTSLEHIVLQAVAPHA
jgi:hypothetical protein